jgi:tRNA threonylcarbamoyladenosine biosynthesis protein TsaE
VETITLDTHGAEETRALGARLGRQLAAGDVLCLRGELGAGKTVLAQGVAAGLGVAEPVSSPTFNLLQEYAGRVPVYHLDAYRVDSLDELIDLGFPELWHAGGVLLIEWPERIGPALPRDRLEAHLDVVPEEGDTDWRRVTLIARGAHARAVLHSVAGESRES